MLSNLFCSPPGYSDLASVMPAPAWSVPEVNSSFLTFQVFESFSSLIQQNLFSRVHHSFALNLPVKVPAFQFVPFKQVRTFVPLSSLFGCFAKDWFQSFGHCLVEFNIPNISAFFAYSSDFVHALSWRCVHNYCAKARFIRVTYFSGCHAFVSWLALRLSKNGSGCYCNPDQKLSFHSSFPSLVSNRNVLGGAL